MYLYHDLYGYLMQMSPDLVDFLARFATATTAADVVAACADQFEGQASTFVDVFYQHAVLIEPDDDEVSGIWPMIAVRGKWNVWRRRGDTITLYTAWGERPVQRLELDAVDTAIWDAFDGEIRLNELRAKHDGKRVAALVRRLTHSSVQALKLSAFPMSMFAKRPSTTPSYLISTMPYPAWAPGQPVPEAVADVATETYYRAIDDADAQFDHQETTLSHLLREPHPALGGRRYGDALIAGLAARLPERRVRVLEIGGGLGYVARAVCEALQARGLEVSYTIQEISPRLAEAQRARTEGLPVQVIVGDVLAATHPDDGYDLILSNEMVGDLPAVKLSRPDVGLTIEGDGEVDPALLAALGRPGELVTELGINLDDATEPFYLLTGALELTIRVARWLAPEGTAVITEFGERTMWPKLSSHLDHPELSTHFGHLQQAAISKGLEAKIEFVMDLIDLDRTLEGLATTRSHFRALQALAADAGAVLPKVGYTRALLEQQLGGHVDVATIGELRWDRIEDRLMGLVPHEFKALVCRKPGALN